LNCRKANSLLSAYIDSELTGAEQPQVRGHLRSCDGCAEEYESLRRPKQLLARLSTRDPAAELEGRILHRLAVEANRPAARFNVRGWWSLLGEPDRAALRSGAVFAAVALVALIYVLQPLRGPANQPAMTASSYAQPPRIAPVQIEPMPSMANVPLRDMVEIHHVNDSSQPMGGGVMHLPYTPASIEDRSIP